MSEQHISARRNALGSDLPHRFARPGLDLEQLIESQPEVPALSTSQLIDIDPLTSDLEFDLFDMLLPPRNENDCDASR